MPAPALLLGHLELELAFVVLRPAATELVEPSVGVGLDRVVAIEIDQPPEHRSGHCGLQVDLDFQLVDIARRFRLDQSRLLVLRKLGMIRKVETGFRKDHAPPMTDRAACSGHAPNVKKAVRFQIGPNA